MSAARRGKKRELEDGDDVDGDGDGDAAVDGDSDDDGVAPPAELPVLAYVRACQHIGSAKDCVALGPTPCRVARCPTTSSRFSLRGVCNWSW